MKSIYLSLILLLTAVAVHAQVWTDPAFPNPGDEVIVYFDATAGTGGLAGCNCDVYVHTGLITNNSANNSDWQFVQTQWGVANPDWRMEPVPGTPDLYSWTISPSITEFYQPDAGVDLLRLSFVFRDATGGREGKGPGGADIFYELFPENLPFSSLLFSPNQPQFVAELDDLITVRGAASETSTITVVDNGALLETQTGTALDYQLEVTSGGNHEVVVTFDNGTETLTETFSYIVPVDLGFTAAPAAAKNGHVFVNDTSLLLTLFAPGKETVFAIGSFSDWELDQRFQMKPTAADSTVWWVQIDGVDRESQITYQYLIDGDLRVADPYSLLILDPFADGEIPATTYPNLPEYPFGQTVGILTLIDEAVAEYDWAVDNFDAPPQGELVIYELLVRDFLEDRSYTTLIDSLRYLKDLGINAVQLMPVSEFENNNSWGYNPSFHKALDKYYGPMYEFKRFVDSCHANNMAVIVDVVYNHAFGQSPLVQMWFDGKPTAESPYMNIDATHPFNVGYDFNHESPATRAYVEDCIKYWLEEFRIDGYRFDLSKGFTQVQNPDNVGAWGQYDASRIAILKHYVDVMASVSPSAYPIMEHFAANDEETELIEYGMMTWGNNNHNMNRAMMGQPGNNVNGIAYQSRGWTTPSLVGYIESHDEERLIYRNLQFGNTANGYNTRILENALRQAEAANVIFYAVPGAKMLWQFGELGYDINIDFNGRVGEKPVLWEYFDVPERRRLFEVTRSMINLRKDYPNTFHTADSDRQLGNFDKVVYLNDSGMNAVALANFLLDSMDMTINFQRTGTWYEYFTGETLTVDALPQILNITPGEYRLYTDQPLPAPRMGHYEVILDTEEALRGTFDWSIFPQPAGDMGSKVRFELLAKADLQLTIITLDGKVVRDQDLGTFVGGSHIIDLPFMAAGEYFVRLTVNNQAVVKPWIVR